MIVILIFFRIIINYCVVFEFLGMHQIQYIAHARLSDSDVGDENVKGLVAGGTVHVVEGDAAVHVVQVLTKGGVAAAVVDAAGTTGWVGDVDMDVKMEVR